MDYIALSSARNGSSDSSGQGEMAPSREAPPDGEISNSRHDMPDTIGRRVHRRRKQPVTVTILIDNRGAFACVPGMNVHED